MEQQQWATSVPGGGCVNWGRGLQEGTAGSRLVLAPGEPCPVLVLASQCRQQHGAGLKKWVPEMKAATQGCMGTGPPGCRHLLMVDGRREGSGASQQENAGVGRAVGKGVARWGG